MTKRARGDEHKSADSTLASIKVKHANDNNNNKISIIIYR